MPVDGRLRGPGEFAQQRYRERAKTWRKRVWRPVLLVAATQCLFMVMLGLLLSPSHLQFYAGLGFGASVSLSMYLLDTPPQRIESWRRGAQGEKATAKALRRLTRSGWTLVHDIQTGRGNIDHVVVGPPGVFLLETKDLAGVAHVHDGVLSIRYPEDPDDGYDLPHLARRVRGQARSLSGQLRTTRNGPIWVQPVVVLWTPFTQSSVESANVGWVAGNRLADVLSRRPNVLDPAEVDAIAAQVRSVASEAPTSPLGELRSAEAE